MERKEQRKRLRAAQRDSSSGLIYRPGVISETGRVQDDFAATKPPKNAAESALFEEMTAQGWALTKRGWPDFFCFKDGRVCCVEVKPRKTSNLKRHQIAVMGYLSANGIPCFLWSPDGGFEEVHGVQTKEERDA